MCIKVHMFGCILFWLWLWAPEYAVAVCLLCFGSFFWPQTESEAHHFGQQQTKRVV